jgi:transposase
MIPCHDCPSRSLSRDDLWAVIQPLRHRHRTHPMAAGAHHPDRNCLAAMVYMGRTSTLAPAACEEFGCGSRSTVWRRLEGRSDPDRWRAVAAAWEQLEHPFEAAYGRFREAEALLADGASRQQAEPVLRAAHQTTMALGALPLRRELELLAQRGRIQLKSPADPQFAVRRHLRWPPRLA